MRRSTRLALATVSFVIIYALLLGPISSGMAQSRKKTRKQKETAEQKAAREKRQAAARAVLYGLSASQAYQNRQTVAAPTASQSPEKRKVQQPIKLEQPSVIDEKVALHNAQNDEAWGDELSTITVNSVSNPTVKSVSKGSSNSRSAPVLLAPRQAFAAETEPNNTSATAAALGGATVRVRGDVFPANDVDFYSFTATTNDRVFAAVQTAFDASASGDSVLDVIDTDGTTVLESDPNDGTFNAAASSIAGTVIPSPGTYFLRVRHNLTTGTIRPYDLHFNLVTGAPTAESEPNNNPGFANPLPASGFVSGTITAVSPGDSDYYSITLAAGDTVFLSLDMNPERDANVWNGRLGFAVFGTPPQILVVNDANAGASPTDPNSEAFFFTVKDAGTYYVYVDSPVAAGLGADATYNLSVSVHSPEASPGPCTTYNSTNVPVAIPTGLGEVTSTITIPGNPRIADLDVSINLNHTFMQDLDVHLESPAGNNNGLFTDIGAGTVGGTQTLMDIRLDDEAGLPPSFALTSAFVMQPEPAYRLHWFDGEDAGGVWTLRIWDDGAGDGGTLNAWSITICEPPPVSCPSGSTTIYSSDFEAGDGGFTHSGVQDEWERGLPTTVINGQNVITTCNSGTNCWKTDLDGTYNASSDQDLVSPNINLAGASTPIRVNWAMRYAMETATFDNLSVDVREVGNPANSQRLYEFRDATMNNTVGAGPAVTISETAGWGNYTADISAFAGLNVELVFHLDSDTTVQLAGVAIDDVSVVACNAAPPPAGQLLISEFRFRGPGGANDEFIEIYNNSGADHTVADSGAGTGYAIAASDGTARCVIPNGTVIPNRGHYLCVNSVAYSLASYPAGNATTATGNATYTTSIPDNAGIALFDTSIAANFVLANRLDAVGSTAEANVLYKEGAGYPAFAIAGFNTEHSFYRSYCPNNTGVFGTALGCAAGSGGLPKDSNANESDFVFVDTTNLCPFGGGCSTPATSQRLGAPGPENLSSPIQRNSSFPGTLLDPCVSDDLPPNRARDTVPGPGATSTFGHMEIRRTITNNTGANVTRLRFRVIDITTFPNVSGIADLRPLTSTSVVVTVDRAPCGSGTSNVTVEGTTLEQPPAQTNGGGGFNSTLSSGTVTLATPIANGDSIDVRFLLGVQATGRFRIFVNIEALP